MLLSAGVHAALGLFVVLWARSVLLSTCVTALVHGFFVIAGGTFYTAIFPAVIAAGRDEAPSLAWTLTHMTWVMSVGAATFVGAIAQSARQVTAGDILRTLDVLGRWLVPFAGRVGWRSAPATIAAGVLERRFSMVVPSVGDAVRRFRAGQSVRVVVAGTLEDVLSRFETRSSATEPPVAVGRAAQTSEGAALTIEETRVPAGVALRIDAKVVDGASVELDVVMVPGRDRVAPWRAAAFAAAWALFGLVVSDRAPSEQWRAAVPWLMPVAAAFAAVLGYRASSEAELYRSRQARHLTRFALGVATPDAPRPG